MIYKFTIQGKMAGLNELIDYNRKNFKAGNGLKQKHQTKVLKALKGVKIPHPIKYPVNLHYAFYEENKRRDKDNISGFAHKVVQDALVKAKVLTNDGWKYIEGYTDTFYVDQTNPRIEVIIEEVK